MIIPKMLVLDLDGTLLDDQKKINPKNLKLLRHLKEKYPQLLLSIATGRSYLISKNFAQKLKADFLITDDGGAIYKRINQNKYKLVQAFCLPEKASYSIYQLLQKQAVLNSNLTWCMITGLIQYNALLSDKKGTLQKINQAFCPTEKLEQTNLLIFNDFKTLKELGLNTQIIKIITYFGQTKLGRQQSDEFKQHLHNYQLDCLQSLENLFTIHPLGVNKGSTLQYLLKDLKKIKPTEVITVGNDYNDLNMLKLKGFHHYCPSNAAPEIKALQGITILKQTNNQPWLKELLIHYSRTKHTLTPGHIR